MVDTMTTTASTVMVPADVTGLLAVDRDGERAIGQKGDQPGCPPPADTLPRVAEAGVVVDVAHDLEREPEVDHRNDPAGPHPPGSTGVREPWGQDLRVAPRLHQPDARDDPCRYEHGDREQDGEVEGIEDGDRRGVVVRAARVLARQRDRRHGGDRGAQRVQARHDEHPDGQRGGVRRLLGRGVGIGVRRLLRVEPTRAGVVLAHHRLLEKCAHRRVRPASRLAEPNARDVSRITG